MVPSADKKAFCSLILCLLVVCMAGAQSEYSGMDPQVVELEKQFILGNIRDKERILSSSILMREQAARLYTDALNFVFDYAPLLQNEGGMENLAVSAISCAPYAMGDVSVQLLSIFQNWDSRKIQKAILLVYPELGFYGYDAASVFNAYAQHLQRYPREEWDLELMQATLNVLQVIDDPSSFDVFFSYYAIPEDSDTFVIRDCARNALLSAGSDHLNWFSAMLDSGNSQYQRSALQFILENAEFSDFFRAEMAEKALQNAIFIAEETDAFCNDDVALQLMAVSELRRLSWTRSSNLIQRLFPIAVEEHRQGFLTDDELITVISGVQELSSLRAGVLLSDFLKNLNARAEKGDFCSEPLVLAVIRSLGALGDKIAFDSLLYVSYLSYPESVIEASREALARLKW